MNTKKKLLGLAVVAALGAANAYAAPGVKFDATGTSQMGTFVDTFSWAPDNALFKDGTIGAGLITQLLIVGKLVSATNSGGGPGVIIPAGAAFTFELSIPLRLSASGSNILYSYTASDATAANDYFNIFSTTNASVDQSAGTGYGSHSGGPTLASAILTSTVKLNKSFTLSDTIPNPDLSVLYLQNGTALGTSIVTDILGGSANFTMDVTSQNYGFFRQDITTLTENLSLLNEGFGPTPFPSSSTGVAGAPFVAASVQGNTPTFGIATPVTVDTDGDGTGDSAQVKPYNNTVCEGSLARCDIQTTTSSQTMNILNQNAVPEPGSLALLGMGFAAFGVSGLGFRRRSKSKAA